MRTGNRLTLSLLTIALAAGTAAAEIFPGSITLDGITDLSESAGIAPPPAASPAPAGQTAEWTVMVFMNAKNDLEGFGLKDINEMEEAASSDKVNVIVEMGRMKGYSAGDGDWTGVRRYQVKKDGNPSAISSAVIEDLGPRDLGDWKELAEFGKWAKARYPAKRYMLIVWNHGSGWLRDRGRAARGISYDFETGSHINTPQLAAALREIGKVDIYASDACLMQMAEVVYEIKDSASYIVGSEETEPGDGYPYDSLLSAVSLDPEIDPGEFAKKAVDAYADYYQPSGNGITASAIKSAAVPTLLKLTNDMLKAIMAAGEKKLTVNSAQEAQKFAIKENRDLLHFARLVAAETKSADVKAKCNALTEFIKTELVVHNRNYSQLIDGWWPGPLTYYYAYGVAVYLPISATAEGYGELQWAGDSLWDEFIKWYQTP